MLSLLHLENWLGRFKTSPHVFPFLMTPFFFNKYISRKHLSSTSFYLPDTFAPALIACCCQHLWSKSTFFWPPSYVSVISNPFYERLIWAFVWSRPLTAIIFPPSHLNVPLNTLLPSNQIKLLLTPNGVRDRKKSCKRNLTGSLPSAFPARLWPSHVLPIYMRPFPSTYLVQPP